MTGPSQRLQISDYVTGSDAVDGRLLDAVLEEVSTLMKIRPSMSKKMLYRSVHRRGHENARKSKIHDYKGIDDESLSMLQRSEKHWLKKPGEFWNPLKDPPLDCTADRDPQAHLLRYYRYFLASHGA
ncbi:hypothetical protein AC579_8855 [Pseudocercospora musae]|uniref:Uncharacterized protein n=1 Tax=Pseudocercospora musae TaxID=113226 RepID=A0A139IGY3_9PEZI|nr:hypothetical protein AC579_8855 [Pseudocercospora musae]